MSLTSTHHAGAPPEAECASCLLETGRRTHELTPTGSFDPHYRENLTRGDSEIDVGEHTPTVPPPTQLEQGRALSFLLSGTLGGST